MASAEKAILRKEFLARRNEIPEDRRLRLSQRIRERLFRQDAWRSAERILCYVSFMSEVDTHVLIQEALRHEKRIVVPIHDATRHDTPLSEISRFADLSITHRGILQVEPSLRRWVDPGDIDLAIIPGIAFDRLGGRLGFGGGYFDKLLPLMKNTCRLALAFDTQLVPGALPHEAHDVRMDMILTESEAIVIKHST